MELKPLAGRVHDLDLSVVRELAPVDRVHPGLGQAAERIRAAREQDAAVVFMMGAHVIRSGVQRYLMDLMERGLVTCLAVNGAFLIHDFELALIGATTESVARYVAQGQFGLWQETGLLNDMAIKAAREDQGLGQTVGQWIAEQDLPHKDISIAARAWELGIPLTAHVALGQDIVHEHPGCDGAAWGRASYTDFLIYAAQLENLEQGVAASFGSAVMAPEVYLKALAMVRNVARQEGRSVTDFTTLVTDLVDLPDDYTKEAPRGTAGYYFRPWKTMLVRTVAEGGRSIYVQGPHAETIPALWTALVRAERGKE